MTRYIPSLPALLMLLTLSVAAEPAGRLSNQQMENFLLRAKVTGIKTLSVGVTQSRKLTLTKGPWSHSAHFQTVDIHKAVFTSQHETELNFRDCYKYNIAAYRLDRLLNLSMVPVSVERKVNGRVGAVTWWVDNVLMMEKKRIAKKLRPPNVRDWNDQMYQVRVFNELIYNTDANLGNLLITKDWEIHPIDFTRAFRWRRDLRSPENLTRIDRRLYDGLRRLAARTLEREVGEYLSAREIDGLLARRDRIVEHFDQLIAKKGPAAVICEAPGH